MIPDLTLPPPAQPVLPKHVVIELAAAARLHSFLTGVLGNADMAFEVMGELLGSPTPVELGTIGDGMNCEDSMYWHADGLPDKDDIVYEGDPVWKPIQ